MGASKSPEKAATDRATLLLADDEAPIRRGVARQLRSLGYEVIEATSGKHALELLGEHHIDVLLSDISMPDLNGVDLLRLVRERKPDLPVLLMTGAPEIATAVKAVQYGAFEYLTKPLVPAQIEASLTRAVQASRDAAAKREIIDSVVREKEARAPIRLNSAGLIPTGAVLADRYRIVRPLGSGGMGTVYEAQRQDLAQMTVAVKVLHPTLAKRGDSVRRFRREAEMVATLRHPNIVNILDFVRAGDGMTFLVMELLVGTTLSTAIENAPPFSEKRVAFIASQLLSALEATHAMNIVHRDLKPDNVFLTTISSIRDVVKVLDFGIAKLISEPRDLKLTETGTIMGTPAYMAPEYARGESPTVPGDIYGVGCVMYEMLTGKAPFTGGNYNALLFAIQAKEPEPIRERRPEISKDLAAVVARAMSKDPPARFSSATEMLDALAPWVNRDVAGARKSTSPMTSAPTEPLIRHARDRSK
jgi:CheY-like chemotaxis protein